MVSGVGGAGFYDYAMGGEVVTAGVPLGVAGPCRVCGASVADQAGCCPSCGSPVPGPVVPTLTPQMVSDRLVVCTTGLAVTTVAIDVAWVVLVAGIGWGLASGAAYSVTHTWSLPWGIIGAVVGLVAGVGLVVWGYARYGRGLGGLVTRVSCVDPVFYLPTVPVKPRRAGQDPPLMVDTRVGVDPLSRMLAAWQGLVVTGATGAGTPAGVVASGRVGVGPGLVGLVFDSGQVHGFAGVCLIGRSPVGGPGVDVLGLPDLSRQLSPTHVEIRQTVDGDGTWGLWVTDQDSLTGTWIEEAGTLRRLASGVGTRIVSGAMLRFGGYRVQVLADPPAVTPAGHTAPPAGEGTV